MQLLHMFDIEVCNKTRNETAIIKGLGQEHDKTPRRDKRLVR